MKKNGPLAARKQDDHLNRPIPNVLSFTPAGENIECCVPSEWSWETGGKDDTPLTEEEKMQGW